MKKMLVFIVFACFLQLTATEAEVPHTLTTNSSDILNTTTTESTRKQTTEKQSKSSDPTPTASVKAGMAPNTVKPGAGMLETPMTTNATSALGSNLELNGTTNNETNHVETSTTNISDPTPSASVKVATVSDTVKPRTKELEASTPMITMTNQTSFLTPVTGSPTVPNSETKGTTNHETNYVATSTEPPEKPTTNAFFTARQSQTTQPLKPTIQETTSTTKRFETTTVVSAAKESELERQKAVKHGKIVAGIIGGALLVMMIGFLVILYKRQKLKKHQMATSDWAGPTPFLDGETDNNHVTLRSASRISLSSFLPQRFSKTLSLLPETGEEMEEVMPGTTFGGNQEQNEEKAAKEMKENSENSVQTEDTLMINETEPNGQVDTGEKENGQSQTEEPPKEPENEQEQAGNEGSDSAV